MTNRSAEERTAEKGVKNVLEVLSGGGIALHHIVARNAGKTARKKIRGINAVLTGVIGEIAFRRDEGAIQAVLHQIHDVVVDKKREHVLHLCDIKAVGMTNMLHGHGDAAAGVIVGPEAVFALQFIGDHIVLGLKKGIESLPGNARSLADLTDADPRVRLFLH